ncbi:hypothetical protein [Oceanobacillus massiliensis]
MDEMVVQKTNIMETGLSFDNSPKQVPTIPSLFVLSYGTVRNSHLLLLE